MPNWHKHVTPEELQELTEIYQARDRAKARIAEYSAKIQPIMNRAIQRGRRLKDAE